MIRLEDLKLTKLIGSNRKLKLSFLYQGETANYGINLTKYFDEINVTIDTGGLGMDASITHLSKVIRFEPNAISKSIDENDIDEFVANVKEIKELSKFVRDNIDAIIELGEKEELK